MSSLPQGNHATRVIAERLGVNPAEAERIKVEPGKRQEEIREAQRPFFENFLKEIRLTFDYYENQFEKPINQVRLSGGSSVSAGLIQTLDEGFHLEMSNWTPFEKVGVSQALDRGRVDAWAGSLGVCVGLSLRGI